MQSEPNQSSWLAQTGKVIAGLIAVLTAFGIGHSVGKEAGSGERDFLLRQIETSKEAAGAVAIVENLDRLLAVSDQLFNIQSHAQETTELHDLIEQERAAGAIKSERIAQLESDLNITMINLREASDELKLRNKLKEPFDLEPNTSEVFLDGGLPIAVHYIYGSHVAMNILGRQVTMTVGDTEKIVKDSVVCTLNLVGLSENLTKANFTMACD